MRYICCKVQSAEKKNQRSKETEKCTMFMDWKTQYYKVELSN